MTHIKNWKLFTESKKNSTEFDDKWEETENIIANIISISDKYSEEELQMMDYNELNRVANSHEMDNKEI